VDSFQRVSERERERLHTSVDLKEGLWEPLTQCGGKHGVFYFPFVVCRHLRMKVFMFSLCLHKGDLLD
jgi:hypothetical protein